MQFNEEEVAMAEQIFGSAFPRTIGPMGTVIESASHLLQFSEPVYRRARLVKRRTRVGNEVQDNVPLGKEYKVGPKALVLAFHEECYVMQDGGWMPCEMLELMDN